MPMKMALYNKRRSKTDAKGYAKRMRLMKNMPKSYPRPGNLLVKSQYCDFDLTQVFELTSGVGLNPVITQKVFTRYDFGGIVQQVEGFNSAPLWTRIRRVFEEYAVKGFRLEYIPTNYVGSQDGSGAQTTNKGGIVQAYVYQDLNTYNIGGYSDQVAITSNGFQMVNPNNTFVLNMDNK